MTEYTGERGNTQKFWLALIRDVFGVVNPEEYIDFEKEVIIKHIGFIDAYVPSTGTVIEQKSTGKSLDDAFEQAKRYHDWLPLSKRGRYIITCDFNVLHIHDMDAEDLNTPPQIIPVSEANKDNLAFLMTPGETTSREVRISEEAGRLVRSLYEPMLDALDEGAKENNYSKAQYDSARENINILCVRLVFLLYAEDSGLFRKKQFHDYLFGSKHTRLALQELFRVLKLKKDKRDSYIIGKELMDFPYVDGGLFEKDIIIPELAPDLVRIIIEDMSEGFDWSPISPTIFGAIFESVLNEETRKNIGIHYTSPENIRKVIEPLFLKELEAELDSLMTLPEGGEKFRLLREFQDRLASLRFLDPACGSGNFLTESFTALRRIENKILNALPDDGKRAVKVSITQFHGIEVHDFAVNVARTALWISDHQMLKETQKIFMPDKVALPLVKYNHIKEGDAMAELPGLAEGWTTAGWNVPHEDMLYIMGNPPFLGYFQQNDTQKKNVRDSFGKAKSDYVSCWFYKAAEMVQEPRTKAAFVATNSIVQGEQVGYVWKVLHERFGIKIDFAHLPFVWKNKMPDKKNMARVHVVVIGMSTCPPEKRRLFDGDNLFLTDNINFYLAEGPDEDIAESMDTPISPDVPEMLLGNLPRDGGNLIIEGGDYAEFIKREPKAEKFIRRYLNSYDFINNIPRYCLWIEDFNPDEIRKMPLVYERIKAVEKFRLSSTREATRKLAKTSWLFAEIRQPKKKYIAIPEVSSQRRCYIPIAWLSQEMIPGHLYTISDATLYHFGVLTSRVHMAWMRAVAGRLRMDYSYSSTLVYNTFAWPSPSAKQRAKIEKTAQGILDARAKFPGTSFAGLYDDSLMPQELRKAHELNDAAVCEAYGWDADISDNEIVNGLFRLYHELVK